MKKLLNNLSLPSISTLINSGKVLLFILVACVTSWGMAVLWSSRGDWWLRLLPESFKRVAYLMLKSILSADTAAAEDQLDFYFFWVPSFFMTITIGLLGLYMWRYFLQRSVS